MGKLIYYDFRAKQREEQFTQMQERMLARLLIKPQDVTQDILDEEKQDEIKFQELIKEQTEWINYERKLIEMGGIRYVPN